MAYTKQSRAIGHLSQPVRLRFPNLFTPKPVMFQGQPKGGPFFSAGLVIGPDQVQLVQEINTIQMELVNAAWPEGVLPQDFHWALNPASTAAPKDANIQDCMLMNANAKADNPPSVLVRNPDWIPGTNTPENPKFIPVTDQRLIYSGCQAIVGVGLYTYLNSAVKGGVGCGLNLVLLTGRDVGRYDGRVPDATALADLGDDATVAVYAPPPPAGPAAAMPQAGMPPAGMPPAGMPPAGMPPAGMPPAGMPPAGMPPAGMPPVGMPPVGMPPAGMPPAATPQAGMPPAGAPPAGYPGAIPAGAPAAAAAAPVAGVPAAAPPGAAPPGYAYDANGNLVPSNIPF